MIRFCKIFLWQLLKVLLIPIGFACGAAAAYYVTDSVPQNWDGTVFIIFIVTFLILSFVVPYWLEYRPRLGGSSLLMEILLMLAAMAIVIGSLYLGLLLAADIASGVIVNDGTGLGILLFLLTGSSAGIIVGAPLAALVTSIWKFWRGGGKQTAPDVNAALDAS